MKNLGKIFCAFALLLAAMLVIGNCSTAYAYVPPTEVTITVTPASEASHNTFVYDGSRKQCTYYQLTISGAGKTYTEDVYITDNQEYVWGGTEGIELNSATRPGFRMKVYFKSSYVSDDAGEYNASYSVGSLVKQSADAEDWSENPSNVKLNFKDGTVYITKRPITVTSNSYAAENFDGQPVEIMYTIVDETTGASVTAKAGETITLPVTGETITIRNSLTAEQRTNIGSFDNDFTIEWGSAKPSNYSVTKNVGKIEIIKQPVTVTINGASETKTYNGAEQTVSGFTIETDVDAYTVGDVTASVMPSVKGTKAGTHTQPLDEYTFVNTNDNYDVTFVIGTPVTLTINPKPVTVTINGNSDTKIYNGAEQTVSGYTANADDSAYNIANVSADPQPDQRRIRNEDL